MPKLKRGDSEERATDFVESLDRGLRLLQKFGSTSGPMTLSDLARAADLPCVELLQRVGPQDIPGVEAGVVDPQRRAVEDSR